MSGWRPQCLLRSKVRLSIRLIPPPYLRADPSSSATVSSFAQSLGTVLPQVNIPIFGGSNPKMWIKRSETSFEFYTVPKEMWVRLAIFQFEGSAMF